MPYCAVADCSNNCSTKGVSLHRFPLTNSKLCKAWMILCKRGDKGFKPNLSSRICSDHFLYEDYEMDRMSELMGTPPKNRLKPGTVPSVFPARLTGQDNGPRNERAQKRYQKILIQEATQLGELQQTPQGISTQTEQNTSNRITQTDPSLFENSIASLKAKIKALKEKLAIKNELTKTLKMQLLKRNLAVKPKRKWTKNNIIKALALRTVSLKGYETVRQVWKLNLPAPRTLRSHIQNFECVPGVISQVVQALKIKSEKMDKFSKICGLLFDEMSLDSRFVWDKFRDQVYSSSKVQVGMIRGICSNWGQPIFYQFDTAMNSTILFQIIKTVESIGFSIVSVTCDLGAENQALLKSLGVSPNSTSFKNPADSSREVYVFADVPHMLKLIRNHLVDDGLETFNGVKINKDVLNELVKANGSERRLCPHLTPKLLDLKGAERMRVRPAARLLSFRVSKLAELVFPSAPEIASFFKIINDGFDVLNSKTPLDKDVPLKSGYGVRLTEQDEALMKLEGLLAKICFYTEGNNSSNQKTLKKVMLPCQKGFILSIRSFQALRRCLKEEFGIHYLLGVRVTQDILESFFSMVRAFGGCNVAPTALDFRYRLRLLILGSKIRRPMGTNCESEDLNYLASEIILNLKLPERQTKTSEFCSPQSILSSSYEFPSAHDFNSDKESLRYIAGYIAWKLKRLGKGEFGIPSAFVKIPEGSATWISHLSRGGLIIPNEDFFKDIQSCETIFTDVIKVNFMGSNVAKNCEDEVLQKFPGINPIVVKEFIKCRLQIRIKELNSVKSSRINVKKAKQFLSSI